MLLQVVGRLGQAQLVRRQIANALHFSVRLESGLLNSTLGAFNDAVLADIEAHYANPTERPYPPSDNTLLAELTTYLELAGMSDPLTKIYVAAELRAKHLPLLLSVFVIAQLQHFDYDPTLRQLVHRAKRKRSVSGCACWCDRCESDCLCLCARVVVRFVLFSFASVSSSKDWFDFTPFVVGVLTLLKQFHSLHTQKFLSYLGQHVRCLVNGLDRSEKAAQKRADDYPPSVVNVLLFLEEFCTYGTLARRIVEQYLPSFVLNSFGRSAADGERG